MTRGLFKSVARGALVLSALGAAMVLPAGVARADGMIVVQLASLQSEARAKDEWNRLQDRYGELLGDMHLLLDRADLGDRGIFFRMQTGPFPNRMTAKDMCNQLKAEALECIVTER